MDLLSELALSSATIETGNNSMPRFREWWASQREKSRFSVDQIPFADLDQWTFDREGRIVHKSGKYFSVRGIDVRTSAGIKSAWSQPIIVQPEIGILGILAQRRDGVLHFLLQGKMEPGNVNGLQLSPTVQATRSNYTRVHGGTLPPYLEWFTDLRAGTVIVDQLQSEQGARFFRKRNRNMIVRVDEGVEVPLLNNFMWLTLGQIRHLLREDNVVNMNTRSVFASVQPGARSPGTEPAVLPAAVYAGWDQLDVELLESLMPGPEFASDETIISWFTGLKSQTDFDVTFCRLDDLREWQVGTQAISHVDGKYFDVIAVRAAVSQREVLTWTQPMIQQREPGIVGFLIKKLEGRYHLLVQAKLEVGNFDVLEMAPTVQCLTGSYRQPEYPVPFLDRFLSDTATVRYDTSLSEEGGRFFREVNRYMVVEVAEDEPVTLPAQYVWMTFRQAKNFIKFNNYFNVEARSLLSCISPL
jgi:oxidase EvaA